MVELRFTQFEYLLSDRQKDKISTVGFWPWVMAAYWHNKKISSTITYNNPFGYMSESVSKRSLCEYVYIDTIQYFYFVDYVELQITLSNF